MDIPSGINVTDEDTKTILNTDLEKIHEIEQDMWAEGLGEYVQCPCCSMIYGKKDIFGHLSKDIYTNTVKMIEQTLALDSIKCNNCKTDTKHIWGDDYIYDIKDRYNDNGSFLTTLRNEYGDIIGFSDGYINDYDTIYKREFEHYYSMIGKDYIRERIENLLGGNIPENLFMHSTIGVEAKYSNLKNFLLISKHFHLNVLSKIPHKMTGIYESSLGTTIHKIYHVLGGKRIGINNDTNLIQNTSGEKLSDIFIHPDISNSTIKKLPVSYKDFLKQNLQKMKEV